MSTYTGTQCDVIPAGLSLMNFRHAVLDGQFSGITDVDAIYQDGIHMTSLGSYIVNLTAFTVIYKMSPVNKVSVRPPSISQGDALKIQQIVWDTVSNYPQSGLYIDPTTPTPSPTLEPTATPTPTPMLSYSVSLGCLSVTNGINTGDTTYDDYMNAAGVTDVTIRASYKSPIILGATTINKTSKDATLENILNGSYVITVSRNGYLIRDIGITMAGANLVLGDKSLLSGDVFVDGIVDGSDSESLFSAIGFSYGNLNYVPEFDLNLDGIIDGTDTEMLFANLGLDVGYYGETVDYYN